MKANQNYTEEDCTSMKTTRTLILTALTLAALTTSIWAQTETASNTVPASGPAPAPAAAAAPPAVTVADIQELKDALAAQQRQIQALQALLQAKEAGQQLAPATGDSSSTLAAAPPVAPSPVAARPSSSTTADSPAVLAANLQESPTNKSQ